MALRFAFLLATGIFSEAGASACFFVIIYSSWRAHGYTRLRIAVEIRRDLDADIKVGDRLALRFVLAPIYRLVVGTFDTHIHARRQGCPVPNSLFEKYWITIKTPVDIILMTTARILFVKGTVEEIKAGGRADDCLSRLRHPDRGHTTFESLNFVIIWGEIYISGNDDGGVLVSGDGSGISSMSSEALNIADWFGYIRVRSLILKIRD